MFVVKDNKKDAYLLFDRSVFDMDIITTAEPVGSVEAATRLTNVHSLEILLADVTKTYDTSECIIVDLDKAKEEEKQKAKEKAQAAMKNAWEHTSEQKRISMVKGIIDEKGEEEADKWLDYVGETDKEKYLHPVNQPDELTDFISKLTDDQKEKLKELLK